MKREPAVLLILAVIITFTAASCCLFGSGKTDDSRDVTPTEYKIAVINMELNDTSDSSHDRQIINASSTNPEIIDLTLTSGVGSLAYILNNPYDALADGATYDECIITPLYIEMELEIAFHVPASADENGYNLIFSADGDESQALVRFYFNPDPDHDYWRRDIAVYLSGIEDGTGTPVAAYPDGWYWLRRVIEPGADTDFFILAEDDAASLSPTHPASGIGPESIIDQFDNSVFWGAEEDYDDATHETVIDTFNDVGGLNASWDDFTFYTGYTISCEPIITNTLNFWYETDASKMSATMASDLDVIDLGPDYDDPSVSGDEEKYGDWGFHPFMPSFTNDSTAP